MVVPETARRGKSGDNGALPITGEAMLRQPLLSCALLAVCAAAHADWNAAANNAFYVILVDQSGADAWPITATTYIIMYKQPSDPAASADTLKFFKWAYANGGDMAKGLVYVPLPAAAVQAIQASWKQIQGSGM